MLGPTAFVAIPGGDYAVRCHVPDSEADEAEDDDEPSLSEIEKKTLTPEEAA